MPPDSTQSWPSVDSQPSGATTEAVVQLDGIVKRYNEGRPSEVEVLHAIDLTLRHGEFVALMGPSGSGKSTLLNIIGLLDRPTSGLFFLNGSDTGALDDAALTQLRSENIGFVFQYHHLLSAFTALENVMLPMLVHRTFPDDAMRERARALLMRVGLADWADNPANALSGGQQQRVAIARALAMNPALVLADEPTGNLDTSSADAVFSLLRQANVENGTTFLLVTHNVDLARRCDRTIEVVDGRIVRTNPTSRASGVVA
jgi:lipoprotein-releasing system ATP-binding protein